MPFHFCADELYMIMAMIPVIGVFFKRIHMWYHIKFGHKCHEKTCNDNHVEHNDAERIAQVERTLEESKPSGVNLHLEASQVVSNYLDNKNEKNS